MSEATIRVVETPNPDAYLFRVTETLVGSGTFEFLKGSDTSDAPLAERILCIDGVELILIAPRFITVRKLTEASWDPLASVVASTLNEFLLSGEMAVIEQAALSPEAASELEAQVIEILNEDIRPAIAQDGGDVVCHGIENGIVKLELIGACGTCPSSTATLQYGIQSLLMEEFPDDILGVEQITSEAQ